ncbi:hypothetical protein BO70DRAFT_392595 [Aspergillus heteromorphus CBS 117.55]|uniref:Uncharacterized protein n=1 Tax=Aspergillus heteromorphus CBS 117.55 TaxID=1448321 RepID=A0A317WY68_9EURO|nr:uncharacterized protein BO70DRAFT_392595 [Aspergillus heteromorphus CBS 117.55]PWY90925.1 hypothetical protein BO70DRAFT_392595 [Aspergillus heteromorphus CBS 117.55]
MASASGFDLSEGPFRTTVGMTYATGSDRANLQRQRGGRSVGASEPEAMLSTAHHRRVTEIKQLTHKQGSQWGCPDEKCFGASAIILRWAQWLVGCYWLRPEAASDKTGTMTVLRLQAESSCGQ